MEKLNAVSMRTVLWETLNEVKGNKIDASVADAVASQSREILRSIKVQLSILSQAKQNVTAELIEFASPNNK